MSPFLKGLLSIIGGFVVVIVALVVIVTLTFDPNDYKSEIQTEVRTQTGRELVLSGPLSLSLFPWLGVQAENVSLANAPGFTDAQFAELAGFEARLHLMPLLSGEIEVGRIIIDGLVLNLERREDGSTNWDDLGKAEGDIQREDEAAQEDPAVGKQGDVSASSSDISSLRLAGLDIRNARLQWRDAGQLTVVEGLNLETGPIAEGEASTLALKVALTLADQTRLALDLTSGWQFSLAGPNVALDDFVATLTAEGGAVPGGEQVLKLGLNLHFDGALQRLDVLDGSLETAGEVVSFNAALRELDQAQLATANVETKGLNVAALARQIAVELPPEAANWPSLNLVAKVDAALAEQKVPNASVKVGFGPVQLAADATVSDLAGPVAQGSLRLSPLDLHALLEQLGYGLAKAKSPGPTGLDLNWSVAKDALQISRLSGTLAGEVLAGDVSVKNFSAPAIRANLDLAAVNLEDWKGKPDGDEKAGASKPESEGSKDLNQMEVPMEWARDLNLTARAAIKRLNAYGVKFNDVIWTADARPGQEVKQSLRANAYGGQMVVNNQIDARQAEPQMGLNFSATAVGLGEFLKDGWGSQWISGTTELGLNLASKGGTVGQLRQSANGDARYRLKDGAVQGVSLAGLVRKASAKLQGATAADESNSTSFNEIFGQAVVQSGKLKMQEIGGDNSWLKLAGAGVVDLFGGAYDLQLSPVLLDNPTTRNDKYLSHLIGLAIPIGVSGPLTAPKFSVDLEKLAKEKAQSKLNEKKDELRDKAKDKLGDFLRKL